MLTYERNHSSVPTWKGDIRGLTKSKLAQALDSRPDWIVGGPPCQGFSTVGKRQASDPRNGLIREFYRIVSTVRPTGFVIENVLGLRDMRFVDQVNLLFSDIGYTVSSMVLRAADFGVPQLRRRVVFVGSLSQRWFRGPRATHSATRHVSVMHAIGDLPPLLPGQSVDVYTLPPSNSYQRRMRSGSSILQGHDASKHPLKLVQAISYIPDGGNRTSIPTRLQPSSGFHNSYSRLDSTKPAVAVTQNMGKPSGTRCIHPVQHRGLTAREGARLQSFPDSYHFLGGSTSQRLQIANAVPPLLAKALGAALVDKSRWSDEQPSPTKHRDTDSPTELPTAEQLAHE